MAGRNDKDKGVNVQVLLRCRPFNEEETKKQALQVICCNDLAREVTIRCKDGGKNAERIFTFDKVFGPTAQQKDLYDQAVVPIVNEVLEGFNCTIFAYGQTGTGKTYTMEGEGRKSKNGSNGELPADAGVIPRAVKQIFDTLESQNAEYSVKVTFLELYNEEITDLLAPEDVSKPASEDKQKKPLALMEDGKGGVLVRGLEEEIVTSADEIFTLLERGTAKRRTAETWLNKQSSRSHSLFTITIHIKEATPEGEELIKCGKLNLVDLAGSENISRSGAREGRVREAGEINKSLLTLGRVITALVEHLGHVPYRDSKLTRLLRDSLGGRTKTCIIATVSPSVQCLDETLSTLDYAHRAKNIKNKPEVNQKMMKSTLIKDLYAEIERLKAEIYAAREKSGVYIPKDRYYQEEAEKKAMSDKIEQVEVTLEETNRRFNDLREKFDAKQRLCEELTSNLETTQKTLEYTKKSLSSLKEDYRQAQYAVKEREYVMSRQNESENALTHQACLLRADLEKSIQDVAGLFAKIERKEKESAGNRALVQKFQTELSEHIGNLCIMVIESMSKQNEHLQSLQKQFTSWMDSRAKATEDVNSKVKSLKLLYLCRLQGLQDLVSKHRSHSDATLGEMKLAASNNASSLEEALNLAVREADSVLSELQMCLSDQQGEIADYAHQAREKACASINLITTISETTMSFFENLAKETSMLQDQLEQHYNTKDKDLSDFQRAYEEQAKEEDEKLISDISNLVAKAMGRKADLVNSRISSLREAAVQRKDSLQHSVSNIETATSDAKRKWETFSKQFEDDANSNAALSAAKHCRMELLLQKCGNVTNTVSQQLKSVKTTIATIGRNHEENMGLLSRDGMDANDKHCLELDLARASAEAAAESNTDDILLQVQTYLEHDHERVSQIHSTISTHSSTLNKFQNDHRDRVNNIEEDAKSCLHDNYLEYQPTSTTPTKMVIELPSKDQIDSMRAPAFDVIIEEFRKNNSHDPGLKLLPENGVFKDLKQFHDASIGKDSRMPLSEVNFS